LLDLGWVVTVGVLYDKGLVNSAPDGGPRLESPKECGEFPHQLTPIPCHQRIYRYRVLTDLLDHLRIERGVKRGFDDEPVTFLMHP
jgi:hypothetical protein